MAVDSGHWTMIASGGRLCRRRGSKDKGQRRVKILEFIIRRWKLKSIFLKFGRYFTKILRVLKLFGISIQIKNFILIQLKSSENTLPYKNTPSNHTISFLHLSL